MVLALITAYRAGFSKILLITKWGPWMKKVDYPASTEHGEKKSQKISFRSSDFSKSKQPSKIDDCPDDPTRAEAA